MGEYDVAQVCMDGHVVNDNYRRHPEHNRPFCPKCGQKTIVACPSCSSPIPGDFHVPGVAVLSTSSPTVDPYCGSCGAPYPWTASGLEAARELIDLFEELDEEERDSLKGTLDDLVRESPRTEVAVVKFKRIMKRVGAEGASAMKSILIDLMTDAARRGVWGPPT